jgi:NADH-quinone oxidoreductase subunit H
LGAIIFFAAAFAESNLLPFDLPEGEAELVAGFHVEYGGFKMLLFFIGEYGHMLVASGLMATFFFGGWSIPGVSYDQVFTWAQGVAPSLTKASILTSLIFFLSFMVKLAIFLWIFIHVRWTLPRFRYDQLMDLGWKTMLPWALVNTILTALVIFLVN